MPVKRCHCQLANNRNGSVVNSSSIERIFDFFLHFCQLISAIRTKNVCTRRPSPRYTTKDSDQLKLIKRLTINLLSLIRTFAFKVRDCCMARTHKSLFCTKTVNVTRFDKEDNATQRLVVQLKRNQLVPGSRRKFC